ncbi:hypothetical protein ACFQMA_18565 [Halosimplex aquaticum]|uniref:Uncharacterized protein n=1 Tax=Halosimplex aquaticum TaxID=3026162 RepID=A0ABD5Y3A6_9EURY|nr:hypothetical protein [Halosimplex aquaticum]
MVRITERSRLERVEHILGSGSGILDFAVEGEPNYYTWEGNEGSDWVIDDVDYVENDDEDRFILYPEEDFFICEIEDESVQCWSE